MKTFLLSTKFKKKNCKSLKIISACLESVECYNVKFKDVDIYKRNVKQKTK